MASYGNYIMVFSINYSDSSQNVRLIDTKEGIKFLFYFYL